MGKSEGREPSRQVETTRDRASRKQLQQLEMFGFLVLACLLNAFAMVYWLKQTNLRGLGLIACSFVVFLMCMTVMPQSETLIFLGNRGGIVRSAFIMGLSVSLSFSLTAGLVFWRRAASGEEQTLWQFPPKVDFVRKLIVSAVLYVCLYVLAGYFIAWQNPALRALYGGAESSGFWELVTSPPVSNRIIPIQIARGIVWTFLCVGMLRVSLGKRWFVAVSIGLVFATVMNSQLLLPNPIMSEEVRLVHLLETATSNFLFGIGCVWLWARTDANPEHAG